LELKAAGDKLGADRLSKLARPALSIWVVNQLFWRERALFDQLLSTAERLRKGDLSATNAHRTSLVTLRSRAAAILSDAGHASSEATLRRVTTTLSALAAAGGFDPDPPGALSADREALGFEAPGLSTAVPQSVLKSAAEVSERSRSHDAAQAAAEQELTLERAAQRKLERQRLLTSLRDAKAEAEACAREVERLCSQLAEAQDRAQRAQATVVDLEMRLGRIVG
jgi:hypothetical protein